MTYVVAYWRNVTTGEVHASYPIDNIDEIAEVVKKGMNDDFDGEILDSIVTYPTYAEAIDATDSCDENLWNAPSGTLTPSLRDRHEKEKTEHGWSNWEIFALGLDNTLLQEFADRLHEFEYDEWSHNLHMISDTVEEGFYHENMTPYEYEDVANTIAEFHKSADNTLREIAENVTTLMNVDDISGIVRIMGEAIEAFGNPGLMSWPGQGNYEEYDNWVNDCNKFGKMLQSENLEEVREAFLWLADWHGHIWE